MSSGSEKDHEIYEYQTCSERIDKGADEFAQKVGLDNPSGISLSGGPAAAGETIAGMTKEAHFLPAWIELRKEIAKDIKSYLEKADRFPAQLTGREMDEINDKIRKFNGMVPTGTLQRGFLSSDNIRSKYEYWL